MLREPRSLLHLFREEHPRVVLDDVDEAQVWALAALAALARDENPVAEVRVGDGPVSQFAKAIGFVDVQRGRPSASRGEPGRTFKIVRIQQQAQVDALAREVAQLVVPDEESDEAKRTVTFVVTELLRNIVQHAHDPLGGVVAAQRMHAGRGGYAKEVVQVVVADTGVGILEALRQSHPELVDTQSAIMKAMLPHISGTFRQGFTGSKYNAGMGLYMLTEIAKSTGGRMLIASRGDALTVQGDLENESKPRIDWVGCGYPGTLVAFELVLDNIADHAGLIAHISAKARDRSPVRTSTPSLRFETPPPGTKGFPVYPFREDVEHAAELAQSKLLPLLLQREPVELDFRHITLCTQSFAHALLFEAVRVSWALKVPIFITNAAPAVRTVIELVDHYAQGG